MLIKLTHTILPDIGIEPELWKRHEPAHGKNELLLKKITNTVLVFGINNCYFYVKLNKKSMSEELLEFSALIDQQFEMADIPDESLLDCLLNLVK